MAAQVARENRISVVGKPVAVREILEVWAIPAVPLQRGKTAPEACLC
jgi:hypothetical protein